MQPNNFGKQRQSVAYTQWKCFNMIYQSFGFYCFLHSISTGLTIIIDNIQQIADAVQKGLKLVVRASLQQGSARLTRLRNELCSDSFHAMLAWSCRRVKCQCCTATGTVVVYGFIL